MKSFHQNKQILLFLSCLLCLLFCVTLNTRPVLALTGPSHQPLHGDVFFLNGRCRICEIDCKEFIDAGIFTHCSYRYYRYGCDAKFFCLSMDDLKYQEKYVAVALCAAESYCSFSNQVFSTQTLEDRLRIPTEMRIASVQQGSAAWRENQKKKLALISQEIYDIVEMYPENTEDHRRRRNTYIRPLVLSYIHPGPGPLTRFKQGSDIYDMRHNPFGVTQYIHRWNTRIPWYLKNVLNPIVTQAEANIFMYQANNWENLRSGDIVVPEFFFYQHSIQYLWYTDEWANRYRTFIRCPYVQAEPHCTMNLPHRSPGQKCTVQQTNVYCKTWENNRLAIPGLLESMRLYIEKTYYRKKINFANAAQRAHLLNMVRRVEAEERVNWRFVWEVELMLQANKPTKALTLNRWSNYGGVYQAPRTSKHGTICLISGVARGTTWHQQMATTDQQCRPPSRLIFDALNHLRGARIDVLANGQVTHVAGGGQNDWVSFSGFAVGLNSRALPLEHGWRNYQVGYHGATITIDRGFCVINGLVIGGRSNMVTRVPRDCIPSRRLTFKVNHGAGIVRVDVTQNGEVMVVKNHLHNGWLSLSGIVYAPHPQMTLHRNWLWSNDNALYMTLSAYTDGKFCVVQGTLVSSSFHSGSVITTLPTNCRPKQREIFGVISNGRVNRVDVLQNGQMLWLGGNPRHTRASVSFSGIMFSRD